MTTRRTAEMPTWQYHIPSPRPPLAKSQGRRIGDHLRESVPTTGEIQAPAVDGAAIRTPHRHGPCQALQVRAIRIQRSKSCTLVQRAGGPGA